MVEILVAFDLYGTLLSTESIAKKLAHDFGQDKANSIAAIWRKYQLEYTWRLNSMNQYQPFSDITRNSLVHALHENHVKLDEPGIDDMMKAYDSLSIFPDVGPALEKLGSKSNIQCVVFSNGTKTMVSNSIKKSAELSPYASVFKNIVTVDFVRSFKPKPEVYRYLSLVAGMTGKENEMWLVSGNPFDVCGARAVGMQAAWVDRAGSGWQDMLGGQPTVIVKSLEEVADAIEGHARNNKIELSSEPNS